MTDPENVILVLDATGHRILHASPGADVLLHRISEAGGRVVPALRLEDQIARARLRMDHPVLVRLHLDPRRLAPPTLVSLMRVSLTGAREALLLVANAPLPGLAARGARTRGLSRSESDPAAGPLQAQATEAASETLEPIVARQRFTWQSNAEGRIVRVSQAAGTAFRQRLEGRTWQTLADAAILRDAGGLLTALASGRTFRTIPITLFDPCGTLCDLELSGAPIGRTEIGFRGFGQVRAITAVPPSPPSEPEVASPIAAEPQGEGAVSAIPEPSESQPAPDLSDPHLSSNEHAAFREIARALGARFAVDECPDSGAEPSLPCAVMPFPVQYARSPDDPSPDAAIVATLERIPSGVLVYRDNTVLFANRPLLDLVGYASREDLTVVGGIERLFGGLDPRTRPAGEAPLALVAREGGRVSVLIEHSVLDWAGRPADLLLVRDAEPSEDARSATATVIAQDFAARHGADALAVLDALEDGVVLLDHRARMLSLNRKAAETFRLDPREVVGASFLGLFASEHAVDLLARLHAEPGSAVMDDASVAARGTGRRLLVRVRPLAGDAESRLCAVIRDEGPTPDRRATDPLDRHARDKPVAHQAELLMQVGQAVQGPIEAILGSIEGVLGEAAAPSGSEERYRTCLQEVHASGAHLLDLVKDVLDLARIESGTIDLDLSEISLNEVVSRCVALLQPEASRRRIVLRTSFSADLPSLTADERSVRQATVNVIASAIALTEPGGQVIVSTTLADRGEIALRIRDTGIGMTTDEVEGALNPFRPGTQPVSRGGTGLGLPLTKALVEANRGRFRISSRKDEGTLVELLFPVRGATMRA